MEQLIRIGMDTSKTVFQLHGVNAAEQVVLRRKLRRKDMTAFFEKLPPTVVAIEACGASHHWARLLTSFGHEVKLMEQNSGLHAVEWRDGAILSGADPRREGAAAVR